MGSEANYRAKPNSFSSPTTYVAHTLDRRKQADLLILDFSKAFDKVPHRRLAHKLDWYGVRNKSLAWITAFLKDRIQRVLLDGETSTPEASHERGPTGHCPGPRLGSGIHQRPARVDHQQQRKTLCWRLCIVSQHHRQKRHRPSTTRSWRTWEMGGQVADGTQRRQVFCHARNSLQTQNTTPVHTTQPNTHTCQTLQIPGSNPLGRPNLAQPHIQRSRWRLQNTQLPPQNSPHRKTPKPLHTKHLFDQNSNTRPLYGIHTTPSGGMR